MKSIGVIGLGYVGLPVALAFARAGLRVVGLDTDARKVAALRRGRSYIRHIPAAGIRAQVRAGRLEASTDFSRVRDLDAVIICVPTPLERRARGERRPDLSHVLNTGRALAPFLRPGTLVVLESTTYPGTTEEVLRPVLEEGSGLKAGRDFPLAYSPERVDPGNPRSALAAVPKVVGGFTPACRRRALALYRRVTRRLVPVSSCRAAEAAKLLENIFRSVNIALVNELKEIYAAMGIDIWEVIAAARTKPFGFMPFYPGPGLGGHCIPIDPFYLSWKARQFGVDSRFIELAGEVNTGMPARVVQRVAQALRARGRTLRGSRILLLGVAYKPNVDDDRESPSYVLMELLTRRGATVAYHDPCVPVIRPTREHSQWAGQRSVRWNQRTIASFDAVLIATAHDGVDYAALGRWAQCIVDTRHAMVRVTHDPARVWKA